MLGGLLGEEEWVSWVGEGERGCGEVDGEKGGRGEGTEGWRSMLKGEELRVGRARKGGKGTKLRVERWRETEEEEAGTR